jgi:hypothetical protein
LHVSVRAQATSVAEAISLTWDQWADGMRVDTSHRWLMLQILGDVEKGRIGITTRVICRAEDASPAFAAANAGSLESVSSDADSPITHLLPFAGNGP